jgi:hypothetical protein
MADIPGFRDALFQSMARRLRETDAEIADATDRQEQALADTTETPDSTRRREAEASTSDARPTSHNLHSGSHRRWG